MRLYTIELFRVRDGELQVQRLVPREAHEAIRVALLVAGHGWEVVVSRADATDYVA